MRSSNPGSVKGYRGRSREAEMPNAVNTASELSSSEKKVRVESIGMVLSTPFMQVSAQRPVYHTSLPPPKTAVRTFAGSSVSSTLGTFDPPMLPKPGGT